MIDADVPIAHWQLDDAVSGGSPVTVMSEDFESPVSFTRIGSGRVRSSRTEALSGNRSAYKTSNNDPNGAWPALPTPVSGSFTFDV